MPYQRVVIDTAQLVCECQYNRTYNIGTWIHRYDGTDAHEYIDWNNKYAENVLLLYADDTFTYNWVDRYDSTDYKFILASGVTYRVTAWGEGEGDWSIQDEKLTLDYTDRKPVVISVTIDKKGRKLKMGKWIFRKRLH